MAPFSVSTTAMMSPRLSDVAGLLQPFDQRAGFHVGAERGHPELGHRATSVHGSARDGSDDGRGLRKRGVFEMLRIRNRHFRRADARDRRLELVERCSESRATISADRLPLRQPSSTITTRRVLRTDATIVFMSSGRSVRRSMTSASMPSLRKRVGRGQSLVQRRAIRDDRHVAARRGGRPRDR